MLRRLAKIVAYSPRIQSLMERVEIFVPPVRIWHRAQYERHFRKFYPWERLFQGVYPTYAAALEAIPKDRPVGYDNAAAATFLGQHSPMLPSEYPILFWLTRLLGDPAVKPSVFDFGGSLGLGYNWYRPYGILPPDLQWTIYDVPAVVEAGKEILAREPDAALHFTADFSEASSSSILLASGALHFEPRPFAVLLAHLDTLPDHLLINKFPACDRTTFYTVMNMGPAMAPYRVSNRTEFIQSLEALGYRLVDSWKNPELTAYIPFHPYESVAAFDGFYLRKQAVTP